MKRSSARAYTRRPASSGLSDDDTQRLRQTIRDALQAGIEREGREHQLVSQSRMAKKARSQDYFFVYGRTGLPCRNCGAAINKIRVAQRGTHFCPECQPTRG